MRISSLAAEMEVVKAKEDRRHHHPRVERGRLTKYLWYSICACGHCQIFPTWRLAFADARRHSEQLNP